MLGVREQRAGLRLESWCTPEARVMTGVDTGLDVRTELKRMEFSGMVAASDTRSLCPE